MKFRFLKKSLVPILLVTQVSNLAFAECDAERKVVADLNRFTPRREEIEREFNEGVQAVHRFIEEEGLDPDNAEVRKKTKQLLEKTRTNRDARLAALEQERTQELSKPIESVNPGFYRAESAPEVFWICDGQYCHVPNADTMQCYGWNQVQLINQDRLNRIYVNRSEGPKKRYSGFVRQKDGCEVYKEKWVIMCCLEEELITEMTNCLAVELRHQSALPTHFDLKVDSS